MKHQLNRLIGQKPMVAITFVFILGILLETALHFGYLTLLIPCLFIMISLPFRYKSPQLILLGFIFLFGCLRMSVAEHTPSDSLSKFDSSIDSVYLIEAVVNGIGETRRGTPKLLLSPHKIGNKSISTGQLILYAKDMSIIPGLGDTLLASFSLNKPRRMRNPHDFDYQKYLTDKGIYFEAFLDRSDSVQVRHDEAFNINRSIVKIQNYVKAQFGDDLSPRVTGLMSALILGERGSVEEEIRTAFANTGVIHVLAVSGLHVGYVSLILIIAIGLMRLPKLGEVILVITGLFAYVLLTGGAPSVMRASLMATLVIIGRHIERKTDVINILATAAFILLIVDPKQLWNIGFQLSFSAVLSIVLLFPVFKSWVPVLSFRRVWLNKSLSAIVDLFLVSLAAQLGTLGLTVLYFNKIPLISLLANLLVVPLIGLLVATGLTSLILGSIFPILSIAWAGLIEGGVDLMVWFVAKCSKVSWAYLTVQTPSYFEVILILCSVYILAFMTISRSVKTWIFFLLLWGNSVVWDKIASPAQLEVVMLDVGQGDAIIVHTPQGKTIVVDAGSKFGGRDMGRDIISPYLIQQNWASIDLLVLTHPHNDHIGGALYLLNNHFVKRVLMPDIEYESYGYHQLQIAIDSLHIPVQSAATGMIDSSFNPLMYRVMGPRSFDSDSQPANVNNVSTIMQLFYGNTSLLLTGDAEHEVETDQLAFSHMLNSDLIKVPHHGSKTSSSSQYLNLIDPQVALISVGHRNKYKHPAPTTLAKYSQLNTVVHRTDIDRAIIYRSDGKTWNQHLWDN